ncbi:uncharacterized protein LOC106076382 isoform X2 [Biomphalaria glabrata]|uniref:Uncharacterized protein LOC106076382 isoform X2 n=1 Tax=Biomphalaria glabrata TaxID=6526 RepID=A0A9W2ZEE5_BIOGL|nr:uncharacterized protein LOC106076382 isoform X2 [Biomphalaria glabrata]
MMSETKVLCESFPRGTPNGTVNGNNNNVDTVEGAATGELAKSRSIDLIVPRDGSDVRRSSSHGLDLSKAPVNGHLDESNGLDLTKPEMISAGKYPRSSDPTPYTNGIPSDNQPASVAMTYGSGRSLSAGESLSPFRADPVPNGYSPDNLANGGAFKSKYPDSYNKGLDLDSKYESRFGSKPFEASAPPSSPPSFAPKLSEPYKMSENSFPKPMDAYNKILEDYGNNSRNNNNNNINPGSKLDEDYPSPGKMSLEPYSKLADSYAKQIESLANGYKPEGGSFKQEKPSSPSGYKKESPPLIGFPKSEPLLTNGNIYNSKTDAVTSSSSQPTGQSLPSILNFSASHLRGMSSGDGGLANYLNSYGGGDSRGDRGGSQGGSSDSMSRSSPNNKLACRFCGKTFSQAGYIKAHERLHTGEKPFACSVCGKRFSDPSNWKKHERVHANNKKQGHLMDSPETKVGPFMVCGRTFAQSGSYRMHERRHMADSIQRCHICYATFSSWQDLQRHMASHPQVTQAILEFEEGNQGIIDRLNSGDLGGQLGDGSIGQLGHPDSDGQGHGHLLQGDSRDLGVPHPRCPPPPLIPESLLLESEAAFHVQSQGLYHSPGQLPPFSSILPFRHHPGGPPAFPPSFPSALGLLGPQSLPVTSNADFLTKHSFFNAMLGGPQMKHDALAKLSPGYSTQPPQHHLQQQQLLQEQQQMPKSHENSDGTDVVSTTSAGKRSEAEQRASSRSYSPDRRPELDPLSLLKDDKESPAFGRSVSSDDGLASPDDHNMETNGEDDLAHEMGDNENDEDTDIDDRYTNDRGSYSSTSRRFSPSEDRDRHREREKDRERDRDRERERERDRERDRDRDRERERDRENRERERERDRDKDSFRSRKRSRSFERERRDSLKEKNSASGNSGSSSGMGQAGHRDTEYSNEEEPERDGDYYDQDRGYEQSHSGRSSRDSRHDGIFDHIQAKHKEDSPGAAPLNAGGSSETGDLRPPKRLIERQNLNTRMIPSSSSRKQRHPMRRFSSAGSEQESPQSTSSLPVSSTTAEAIERGDLDDNDLVVFLLTKGRVHKCVHCHMIFKDASLFLLHNGFHAHDEPFRCVVCGSVCKDRIDFNCHLTSHIK